MSEIAAFFEALPQRVQQDKLQGMNCVYQFSVTGDNGGVWSAVIKDNAMRLDQGAVENPTITITVADKDFTDMIAGRLQAQTAFLTGKLRIVGDISLALRLPGLFGLT